MTDYGRDRWLPHPAVPGSGEPAVHIREWGSPDAEQTMVLVHGLGGSALNWARVGGALAAGANARVIAVDLEGFGLTPARAGALDIARHRELVIGLLESVGPSILIGLSLGGAISLGVAARRPDLVARLVLQDPAVPIRGIAGLDPRVPALVGALCIPRVGSWLFDRRSARQSAEQRVDESLAVNLVDPSAVPADLRAEMIAQATTVGNSADRTRAWVDASRSLVVYLTVGAVSDLRRVRGPSLLVHGAQDPLVAPASARAFARANRDMTLTIIENCGHIPSLERPDDFADIVLRWLAAQSIATDAASVPSAPATGGVDVS